MKILFYAILALSSLTLPLKSEEDYWKADDYYQNSSSQKEAASDLMKLVVLKGDEKILDVGCGDGKITAEIAAKIPNGEIVGIDISPSMIEFAKKNFNLSNLSFHLQNAEELNYRDAFDLILSFTALQWVQDHPVFLEGAYQALKPSGMLAISMPMGLPIPLEKAVHEVITRPEWSSHFEHFVTGWNFVDEKEWERLLASHHFHAISLAVVPQRDIFPSREAFEKFISQWFPYLRPLPEELRKPFMAEVIDRFLALETPFPEGQVHFKIKRLESLARK